MRLLSGRSPAHGFRDDEQTRRLLRSRPPRQALAWAAARLGGRVVSARALRGGMSSAVHLITVQRSGADPWGDVVTIVGFLDDLRDGWGSERLLVEDMLTRAVADLAG